MQPSPCRASHTLCFKNENVLILWFCRMFRCSGSVGMFSESSACDFSHKLLLSSKSLQIDIVASAIRPLQYHRSQHHENVYPCLHLHTCVIILFFPTIRDGVNPFFTEYTTPFKTPPFHLIKFEHYMPAFLRAGGRRRKSTPIVHNPELQHSRTRLRLWSAQGTARQGECCFQQSSRANTTDELQKIANEVTPLLSKHRDDITSTRDCFTRQAVYEKRKTARLNAEQLRLLKIHTRISSAAARIHRTKKERFRKSTRTCRCFA